MDTFIQADIFFFITSVSVVLLTLLIIICLFYLLKILKNFKDISDTLKNGVEEVGGHLEDIAESVENSTIFRFIFGKQKSSRKAKKKAKEDK